MLLANVHFYMDGILLLKRMSSSVLGLYNT